MDARERYFQLLDNTIYESNYLYLLFQKYHQRHQVIECSLAILSAGSLAAWLLYNKLAICYAAVIVLTQLINSILPHFEIAKRESALKQAVTEFQPIVRQAEASWRRIESEDLSEKDIEEITQRLELTVANVLDKMMSLGIKDDKKIIKAAEQRAEKYAAKFQSLES